jgi:hypothetical protein
MQVTIRVMRFSSVQKTKIQGATVVVMATATAKMRALRLKARRQDLPGVQRASAGEWLTDRKRGLGYDVAKGRKFSWWA